MNTDTFPIDLNALAPLELDPAVSHLTDSEKSSLKHHNIQLCRDEDCFARCASSRMPKTLKAAVEI